MESGTCSHTALQVHGHFHYHLAWSAVEKWQNALPSRSGAQRTRGGLKSRDAVEVSGRLEAGQKEVALLCPHLCPLQHAFVTASWPLNTWPKCPLNL